MRRVTSACASGTRRLPSASLQHVRSPFVFTHQSHVGSIRRLARDAFWSTCGGVEPVSQSTILRTVDGSVMVLTFTTPGTLGDQQVPLVNTLEPSLATMVVLPTAKMHSPLGPRAV